MRWCVPKGRLLVRGVHTRALLHAHAHTRVLKELDAVRSKPTETGHSSIVPWMSADPAPLNPPSRSTRPLPPSAKRPETVGSASTEKVPTLMFFMLKYVRARVGSGGWGGVVSQSVSRSAALRDHQRMHAYQGPCEEDNNRAEEAFECATCAAVFAVHSTPRWYRPLGCQPAGTTPSSRQHVLHYARDHTPQFVGAQRAPRPVRARDGVWAGDFLVRDPSEDGGDDLSGQV